MYGISLTWMTLALALLAKVRIVPPPTDRSLFLFTLALVIGLLAAAAFLAHRAPAVTIALLGALGAGICGFFIADADGPHWVPAVVSVWASLGLFAFGMLGLAVTHEPSADPRFLSVAGVVGLVLAIPAAIAFGLVLADVCPLYSRRLTGFCFYGGEDLLGGWPAGVAILIFFDMAVVAALLLISARRARE
jgi:hypothetical protein